MLYALCRLVDENLSEFCSASSLSQLFDSVKSLKGTSRATQIISSLLTYSKNQESAEFGVLLSIREQEDRTVLIGWLADALIFPRTEPLSPRNWIFRSSNKALDYMVNNIEFEETVKQSLDYILGLLKNFNNLCHRLPHQPDKRSSILALSELAVNKSFWEQTNRIGVSWAKLFGRHCQTSTDFVNWLSEFSSLRVVNNNRNCSVGLLKSAAKLACCSLNASAVASYMSEAFDLVSSKLEQASMKSASLIFQRLGDALNQNPLFFMSIDSLFQLFCDILSFLPPSGEYKDKVAPILLLFPLAWQSVCLKENYKTVGRIIGTLVNDASVFGQVMKALSQFVIDLGGDDVKLCVQSCSNVLTNWFILFNEKRLADLFRKVTHEMLFFMPPMQQIGKRYFPILILDFPLLLWSSAEI